MEHRRIDASEAKRTANAVLRRTSDEAGCSIPYFCECEDPACFRAIWLEDAEFDRLRELGPICVEAGPAPYATSL